MCQINPCLRHPHTHTHTHNADAVVLPLLPHKLPITTHKSTPSLSNSLCAQSTEPVRECDTELNLMHFEMRVNVSQIVGTMRRLRGGRDGFGLGGGPGFCPRSVLVIEGDIVQYASIHIAYKCSQFPTGLCSICVCVSVLFAAHS